MPRGQYLDLFQRGPISALRDEGWTISRISKHLKLGRTSVTKFVTNGSKYGGVKRRGRKPRMTHREKSVIIRRSSNSSATANQIFAKSKLEFSKVTVNKVRQQCPTLVRWKMRMKPVLSQKHKSARLHWAKERMTWTSKWDNTVFSDEKRFP